VLFISLAIASGYSALLISDFRFYPRLGATMMVTMLISALLSLLFLRAVVALLKPKFIVDQRSDEALPRAISVGVPVQVEKS
jgi:predicted RND superfamily exporter protein